ncbi:16776_t:CDS:2 [Funneliformis caledonium]|uniref:16776_t:CDS:1 n=1 Tax=Funneliformis caledonium TaxID=1117310 RepID=A0A9N9AH72_9GLOM|nr:16776_t:CDS:2 [Funneliformis caledonium]
MPFTLSVPRPEVEPSRPQHIQRANSPLAANHTATTTNHYPRRQRNVFSTLTELIQTNSMVRYGTLIFLVALISVLYFATTHQAIRPTGSGPTIISEYLTVAPDKPPTRSLEDGFPISEGSTEPFGSFEASGKGDVQQVVEGKLHNNTNQGIRGVLYDRGDGCQSIKFNTADSPPTGIVPSIPLPNVFTPYKISLISSDVSNCMFDQKITMSKSDGDKAIIVLVESNSDEEYLLALNSDIPIFTINKSSGESFKTELERLYQAKPNDSSSLYKVLIVTLKPYRQFVVNSWLFAMFAVGGILVASFFVSILIHMRLYRLRRNQQLEIRRQRAADEVLGMKKWTLEKDIIDTFPIIIYDKKSGSTSEEQKISSDMDNFTVQFPLDQHVQQSQQDITTIPANQTSPTVTSASTDDDTDTCAICLEDFENGEEIRELPCKHWYHIECIDPWLTTKSSSCPLCKKDCRPNQNDEIIIDGLTSQEDSNNESDVNNVFVRMGKVFGRLFGKRSTSVRPADTRQQPNDSTVVELA